MKNLMIITLLFCSVAINAQDDSDWYYQYIMKFKAEDILEYGSKQKFTKHHWYKVAENIVNKADIKTQDTQTIILKDELPRSFSGEKVAIDTSKSDWAIIMVSHIADTNRLGVYEFDKKKLNIVLLHRERIKGTVNDYKWSEDLYGTKQLMVIFLGNTGIDGDGKLIDNALEYTKKESFFYSSVKDLVKLIGDSYFQSLSSDISGTVGTDDMLNCKLITNKKKKLKSPSEITFRSPYFNNVTDSTNRTEIRVEVDDFSTMNQYKELFKSNKIPTKTKGTIVLKAPPIPSYEPDFATQKFTIRDKNRFAFTIGASLSQFNYQNFSFDSTRNVVIAGDSADIANWKSNFNINLEYYPFGRDIDNFESVFKAGIRDIHTRLGLVGGLKLSKDPFEVIHGGVVFSVSKTFSVTFGLTWDKEQVNLDGETEERSASTLTDLKSAKSLFNQYGRSNFTVGISLAPSEVIKLLKD